MVGKREETVRADKDKVTAILKERNWNQMLLAEKVGIENSTFSKKLSYNNSKGFSKAEFRLMCMILGKSEDELTFREHAVEPRRDSAHNIINTNAILEQSTKTQQMIDALHEDLLAVAQAVKQLNKEIMEVKAQAQLNRDEINATFNKCTEVNSTINKVSGYLNAKHVAYKKG